jgi:flagellar hook-associated protein 2
MGSFSIPGLGSGIDWNNYIQSIRSAEEGALSRTLGVKQQKLASQQFVYSQVSGLIQSLKSTANGFSSVGDFKTKTVSSSDDTKVTATATISAATLSTSVRIDQKATQEIWHLEHTAVTDSVSTGGTFNITVRGALHSIDVEAGDSLEKLRDKINSAGIGVTATVFDTGGASPSARLAIQDNLTGKFSSDNTAGQNYNIEIDLSALNPTAGLAVMDGDGVNPGTDPIVEGRDSEIRLNGNDSDIIYRDSNTITDVVPGLSLNLKNTTAGEYVTLSVSESVSQAASKVTNLLRKYNDVVTNIRAAIRFDPTQSTQTNPTAGDGTLRSLLQQIQNAFTGVLDSIPTGNKVRSMSDLGVKQAVTGSQSTGALELNEDTLNNLLSSNYEDVIEFFQGGTIDGSTERFEGFASRLDAILNGIVKPVTGSLSGKIASVDDQFKRLNEEINEKFERILQKEERNKARFARLEGQLSRLSGQQSSLQSALASIQLNNQAIAKR